MFGAKKNDAPQIKDGLVPCLPGSVLAESQLFKSYLIEINGLISCPREIYDELYLATIHRLAEFLQLMPFSEKDFNISGGFFERQLKLATAVMKSRRGMLLPKGAVSEQIASEEPQWSYALFSAALLQDICQIQDDRLVTLHYANGEDAGVWSPISGSMCEKNFYYKMKFEPQEKLDDASIFMATIAGRIVPPVVFRWLTRNPQLFFTWWKAIVHSDANNNVIVEVINKVAKTVGIQASARGDADPDQLNLFLGWLIHAAKDNPDQIFRSKSGLFISVSCIDDALPSMNITKSYFLSKLLVENKLIASKDDEYYHTLSSKKFEDQRSIKGVILTPDSLPLQLQDVPLNTVYVENRSL